MARERLGGLFCAATLLCHRRRAELPCPAGLVERAKRQGSCAVSRERSHQSWRGMGERGNPEASAPNARASQRERKHLLEHQQPDAQFRRLATGEDRVITYARSFPAVPWLSPGAPKNPYLTWSKGQTNAGTGRNRPQQRSVMACQQVRQVKANLPIPTDRQSLRAPAEFPASRCDAGHGGSLRARGPSGSSTSPSPCACATWRVAGGFICLPCNPKVVSVSGSSCRPSS